LTVKAKIKKDSDLRTGGFGGNAWGKRPCWEGAGKIRGGNDNNEKIGKADDDGALRTRTKK